MVPTERSETVHEKVMKKASENPRFKEVKNFGEAFVIGGQKPYK